MADEQVGVVVNPTSLEQNIEVVPPVTPAPAPAPAPEPEVVDEELASLGAELESAETPEARKTIQGKINKRFAAITRKHAEDLENVRVKARLEVYESGSAPGTTPPAAEAAPKVEAPALVLPPRPERKDFVDEDGDPDPDKFIEALTDWKVNCRILERDHADAVSKATTTQQETLRKGREFVNKVNSMYPDYRIAAQSAPAMTDLTAAAVLRLNEIDPNSDAAAKVAYYLVKNPDEITRINGLDPMGAVISIGQIASRVAKTPPPQQTISNAPPPSAPVQSSETETFDPLDPNTPMDVYARHHPLYGK